VVAVSEVWVQSGAAGVFERGVGLEKAWWQFQRFGW
jgi:hypothetical protein